jgi:aminopeptidase N
MISYDLRTKHGKITELTITQKGEDGSDRLWPQIFEVALIYPDSIERLKVEVNAKTVHLPEAIGKGQPMGVILNADGQGYGLFPVDGQALPWLFDAGKAPAVMRAAAYINLYENMLAGRALTPLQLLSHDRQMLALEPEELNLNILLDQVASIYWRFLPAAVRDTLAAGLENDCWQAMLRVTSDNEKKLLFRTYSSIVISKEGQNRLFGIWEEQRPPTGVKLSEDDYTNLAAALALRGYPSYKNILQEQLGRITNSDRRERWLFLQPALSADTMDRDHFFALLKDPVIRKKEAWVLTALSYLHHPLRTAYSQKYLQATLDWLEDIQRTGDVFFPQGWLQASFSYYQSPAAAAVVRDFLKAHTDYNPQLRLKILQATDNLMRAQHIVR